MFQKDCELAMSNLIGSCNCGSIKYEVSGAVRKVVNCHCTLCRKMNGSVFSTYAIVLENDFKLLTGYLTSHQVSSDASKHFCGTCGTPIYNTNPKLEGVVILHFGSLDPELELNPDINIYCDSQLSWVQSIAELLSLPGGIPNN